MRNHTDAAFAALAGFVLTAMVMAPPVLSAQAERAARIAAYEQDLGPATTRFGTDRAGRLAGALREGSYREDARKALGAASGQRARQGR